MLLLLLKWEWLVVVTVVVVVVVVVVVTVLKTYSAQELPAVGGCVGEFPQLSQLFSEVTPTIALVCPNDLVQVWLLSAGEVG